ncbi:MAG: extracellular solute-binding protein family 1 [Paenibacillaceae bacterium]|jgi:putative aldouronate transport system substrate-binding protein|nr:extracellular solute-binding protein family 1 [Paenibacillaceae bacterium]
MKMKQWSLGVCSVMVAASVLAGCGSDSEEGGAAPEQSAGASNEPFAVTMALNQAGDIPAKGNAVEQAIMQHTNTKLDIQWIPQSTYDEKVSVMIASNEMPKIMKVNYVPLIISSIESGMFWEVGPYLKDYPNLAAQNEQHFNNISVDGKIYGVPLFRDIGRAAYNYRKDWMDQLGLKLPVTLDDWYNVQKAMVTQDPDKNGKQDSYGVVLEKQYNSGHSALLTRIAVSIGGVNRWGLVNGKITPEIMTQEYTDVLKLFRRMYAEKLINQDFAVLDSSEMGKFFDTGKAGIANSVAAGVKSQQDRLLPNVPDGVVDNSAFTGPNGIRIAGEPGHNGFLALPKASVKTEAEVKQLLKFLDGLMDEPIATLLMRGVENVHYTNTADGKTEFKDFTAFQREVKPYRDNLLNVEGYNVKTLKDTPLGEKGTKMASENAQYAIPNVALTLTSATSRERGSELDLLVNDAMTKYIMGVIDDAGWQKEVDNWLKTGGQKVIEEYQASYDKLKK